MLEITKFTVDAPDSDGDMSTELKVRVRNAGKETMRMVRLQSVLYNDQNIAIGSGSWFDEMTRLESGEEVTVDVSTGYAKEHLLGTSGALSVKVFGTAFAREFAKLGDIPLPKKDLSPVFHTVDTGFKSLEPKLSLILLRGRQDDEGTQSVDIKCALVNTLDEPILKYELKADLLDDEDAIIESNASEDNIPARGISFVELSFWGLRSSRLKNTRVRVTCAVYTAVEQGVVAGDAERMDFDE